MTSIEDLENLADQGKHIEIEPNGNVFVSDNKPRPTIAKVLETIGEEHNRPKNQYPAHEGIKTGELLAWDEVDKTGVQYMCVRLKVYNDLQSEFSSLLSELVQLKEMNGKLGLCVAESRDALCAAEVYMNPTNTSGIYARKQVKEQMERCQLALSELPSPPEQARENEAQK